LHVEGSVARDMLFKHHPDAHLPLPDIERRLKGQADPPGIKSGRRKICLRSQPDKYHGPSSNMAGAKPLILCSVPSVDWQGLCLALRLNLWSRILIGKDFWAGGVL
jgi:hypothetical protein